MISVLVADDHTSVREALGSLLETAGDIVIVATALNGQEAVEQAVLHCPDVTVMDVSMPVMDGIEATKQIRADCPKTRVLMVSAHNTPHYIQSSLQAGALGYVIKDTAGDDLVMAVHSLFQGNRYFSKQIAGIAEYYIE
jgi:Response regulator containing a CheY-like receiver domain and an HTH DNA-binding domain